MLAANGPGGTPSRLGVALLDELLDADSGERADHARRTLEGLCPSLLDVRGAVRAVLAGGIDRRERQVLLATTLAGEYRRTPAQVGARLALPATQIGRIRGRAEDRLRAAGGSPGLLGWLGDAFRTRLGDLASHGRIEALAERLGLHPSEPSVRLLVWLAGPYEPIRDASGWRARDPVALRLATQAALDADGGVRPLAEVLTELRRAGFESPELRGWVVSQGVETAGLLLSRHGTASDLLERVLDAVGHPMTVGEVADLVGSGDLQPLAERFAALGRGRRFQLHPDGRIGLSAWVARPLARRRAAARTRGARGAGVRAGVRTDPKEAVA